MNKFILIDGNAIFHRAYHALPLFQTSTGEYTNAIYGFLKMLIEIIRREKPTYMAVAFDSKEKTFRHVEYDQYKATRSAPPEQLYPQLPRLKEALATLKTRYYELPGYEADDIIGTFAAKIQAQTDLYTIVVTGDKDAFQLVNERVHVMTPLKGVSEVIEYTPEKIFEKTGLKPIQIVDFKALKGDPSDNIKGVPGIGDRGAVELLQKYGTLENIYNHLPELKEGQRKKLEAGREDAIFSKRLATIMHDVPLAIDLQDCLFQKVPLETLKNLFQKLEFKTMLKQAESLKDLIQFEESVQQSMF